MKQILWFRRDLRISDSAILHFAKDEVLPIFIFDKNILDKLSSDDNRVKFIYKSVLKLKEELKKIGLDLAIFYSRPKEVFSKLKDEGFENILCSIDFDSYAKKRDEEISQIIPIQTFTDSFITHPQDCMKSDGTPYKVFTPYYNNLEFIWNSYRLEEFKTNENLKLISFDYESIPSLEDMNFEAQNLPEFLEKSANDLLEEFEEKINNYKIDRDFFDKDATSNLAIHLRFGLISARQVFNKIKELKARTENKEFFIRELFWREFYNYILYHFPKSEFENLKNIKVNWNEDEEVFQKWCDGKTGVPIIDAAMRYFNLTGTMHNRLRMVVSSYLVKNLLVDWKKGERYFASKLVDYEASSNIGSWQWAASTGADSVPYFRIFNPYLQSKKFDKDAIFIKSVLSELKDVDTKQIHSENGVQSNIFLDYPVQIVSIDFSRKRAISEFKRANNEKD
jgi:deoxyribodipyrimidine photo-lyase